MSRHRKLYNELLFQVASTVLPALVLRAPDGTPTGDIVDEAILLARDLLAELDYAPEASR